MIRHLDLELFEPVVELVNHGQTRVEIVGHHSRAIIFAFGQKLLHLFNKFRI